MQFFLQGLLPGQFKNFLRELELGISTLKAGNLFDAISSPPSPSANHSQVHRPSW